MQVFRFKRIPKDELAFHLLPLLFLLSGFAAIIYQIIWQRIIFSTFGINSESVTLVVSIFMAGLGLGALGGGMIQKKLPHYLLECFVAIECGIGLYGLFSLELTQFAGTITPPNSLFALTTTVAALFVIPTFLMGATLPILVSYLEKTTHNIGKTVGILYALNTLGSAIAGLLTVKVLFVVMGLQATLGFACTCNFLTAIATYIVCSTLKKDSAAIANTVNLYNTAIEQEASLTLTQTFMLSGLLGLIALGIQTTWYRLTDFLSAGIAENFGLVLFITLCGVAGGALAVKRHADSQKKMLPFLQHELLVLIFLIAASFPLLMLQGKYLPIIPPILTCFMLLGMQAHKAGAIFPALCHICINTKKNNDAGSQVGLLYFGNILGSTGGCLTIGLFLFDTTSIIDVLLLLLVLSCLCWIVLYKHGTRKASLQAVSVIILLCVGGGFLSHLTPLNFYSTIQAKAENNPLVHVVENRSGVITVEASPKVDIIYGGGAYDGRFNINPVINSNMIQRAYMIAALHPRPQRILDIGLSSGSWASVFTLYTPLQSLVSVEINQGYRTLLTYYEATKDLSTHPKVQFIHDDGRKWLKMHPHEQFDMIVSNTSFHVRNNAVNLLSEEFLQLAKQHLKPGGVIFFNTTSAADCFYTAAKVFKHVVMIQNFAAASDTPFDMTPKQKRENLLQFTQKDGKPIFLQSPQHERVLEELSTMPLKDWGSEALQYKNLWLITDDNMATEFKKNKISPQTYLKFWKHW